MGAGEFKRCVPDLNLNEVEIELKAQVNRAYAMGLEPTHLDSHMGCLFQTPELIEIYFKVGQLYNLPVMAFKEISQELRDRYEVKFTVDSLITISPEEYAKGPEAYYSNVIKNLQPGLSLLLIHTAYDNEEMKGMNIDHPDWGNEWRQKDFDFFISETCKKLLTEENIRLVTYRQLKEAFFTQKTNKD